MKPLTALLTLIGLALLTVAALCINLFTSGALKAFFAFVCPALAFVSGILYALRITEHAEAPEGRTRRVRRNTFRLQGTEAGDTVFKSDWKRTETGDWNATIIPVKGDMPHEDGFLFAGADVSKLDNRIADA